MNKKIILCGTCLFVLACLFQYKTGVVYTEYGIENINVDGFYFFLQDKEERHYTKEICGQYSENYRTCLWTKEELRKNQTRLTTEKDKLIIELLAIVFGTLGLAFALGNKNKEKNKRRMN